MCISATLTQAQTNTHKKRRFLLTLLRKHSDGLAIDDQLAVLLFDGSVEATVHRVLLKHPRHLVQLQSADQKTQKKKKKTTEERDKQDCQTFMKGSLMATTNT
jgi:hypothetical protein